MASTGGLGTSAGGGPAPHVPGPVRETTFLGQIRPRVAAPRLAVAWRRHFAAPDPLPGRLDRWFWAGMAALALVAGGLLYAHLSYPLLEPDEGRYAEVVREMVTSGDWLVPTLNHKPFYDKPPLFYWLVAGSFGLFGMNEQSARLVPATAAFLTVLALYVLGRRLVGLRPAFLGALALALTAGFVLCGRIVILDSLLTLFVTVSLLAACEAVRPGRLRWGWWAASALFCGLGVLTKGPVALVLIGPAVFAYGCLDRGAARPTVTQWAAYTGLTLGLAAPTYAAVIAHDPRFAYHFFVDQHLVRFFKNEYHVRPCWYYVPVLLTGCLPCSLLIVPVGRYVAGRSAAACALRPPALGFLFLWAAWCVLFFSVSKSKLPPYVLPALPPLALVVGCYLDAALSPGTRVLPFGLDPTAVPRTAVAALAGLTLLAALAVRLMGLIGPLHACVQASFGAGGLAAAAFWGRRMRAKGGWLLAGALGAGLAFAAAQEAVPAWSHRRSVSGRCAEVRRLLDEGGTCVVAYGDEWGSVPFYLHRDGLVYNWGDPPPEPMAALLGRHGKALFIVRNNVNFQGLQATLLAGTEMTQIGEVGSARFCLVRPAARPAGRPDPSTQAISFSPALPTMRLGQ